MSKRTFQTTAVNMPMVIYNGLRIFECYRCLEHYDRQSSRCKKTDERILYSIGGPVGLRCPLPKAPMDDDE